MPTKRLSLIHYDVVRELCGDCQEEAFHFVPIGAAPTPSHCPRCGDQRTLVDMSDTSIRRLVTQGDGELRIAPLARA
ncbi:MAG TPA: hypothetical protein VFL80_07530 [Thermoanaerobaculia bacterium]|nr:hypothetical protein [Thermoanaerobaculia bacterium]